MSPAKAPKSLARRSGGQCEICGRRTATNAHHRKNRSQGGTWDVANLLHICGSGTTGCHGEIHARPQTAYANGWSVRGALTPAAVPAWLTSDYGRVYMWLHDDGTKSAVNMPDFQRALLAEEIHDKGAA